MIDDPRLRGLDASACIRAAREGHDPSLVLPALVAAVDRAPRSIEAHVELARWCSAVGLHADAVARLRMAATLAPPAASLHLLVADDEFIEAIAAAIGTDADTRRRLARDAASRHDAQRVVERWLGVVAPGTPRE